MTKTLLPIKSIICLTKNSVDKEGYIQKEIKFALDKALEMPEGRIFLIPVKFEECEVPFTLSRYQWVDLTIESGYQKMMKALKFRASQLERSTVEVSKKDIEENLAREKKEREIAEKDAREKAEKNVAEKARLKAEEEERQRIAKEKADREAAHKLARERAEKEAAEKARLEELARQKSAKEKAELKATGRSEQERKEKELGNKQAREARRDKETREAEKKEEKPATIKPKTSGQIVYWIGGFIVLVLGIIFLSSLNNPSVVGQPITENTQTQAIATLTRDNVEPSAISIPESTSTFMSTPLPTESRIGNLLFDLIYVSREGDEINLYRLFNDGMKENITADTQFTEIADLSLSPNLKDVAFAIDKGIMKVDIKTNELTLVSTFGNRPRWNPVNGQLVFVSDDAGVSGDACSYLYEAYLNGTNTWEAYWNCHISRPGESTVISNQRIYLVDPLNGELNDDSHPLLDVRGVDLPVWDYSGDKLAYVKKQNVDFICIGRVLSANSFFEDGCQQIKDVVESLAWSPRSSEIVYSAQWKGNSNIYILNTEDFSQTSLTTGAFNNYSPVWSNSGQKIAFVSDQDGGNDIFIMDITSRVFENVTPGTSNNFSPIWSPDDASIIFVSDRNGNLDLFSIDLTTRETKNLTNSPGDELYPIVLAEK